MAMYGPPGQPPMGYPGPQMAPPKKKGLWIGCWITMFSVLGFFLLAGGIIAYGTYKVATNKDVQNVMGAIGEAAQLAAEAQAAPGTNELRALGCQTAMAFDASKMQKLGSSFMDASAPPPPPPEVETIVMCQPNAFATPP